eukprot:TRINITY_DN3068_c0_g1_i2.p2 TRINITY_DN3068_c0_g1~~TRINITY_DN3068_c0_g1_i2.p2  ORF type:complete len:174 (+),score=12.26 TRINITY_DN3068_c0_g1_i2:395-916(+)
MLINYVFLYPQLQPLVRTIKSGLKERRLNYYRRGGMNSYSLYILVIAHLILCQKERVIDMNDLGKIFVDFGRRYGNLNAFSGKAVSLLKEEVIVPIEQILRGNKQSNQSFYIEDPILKVNVSERTERISEIVQFFSEIGQCNCFRDVAGGQFYPILGTLWDVELALHLKERKS